MLDGEVEDYESQYRLAQSYSRMNRTILSKRDVRHYLVRTGTLSHITHYTSDFSTLYQRAFEPDSDSEPCCSPHGLRMTFGEVAHDEFRHNIAELMRIRESFEGQSMKSGTKVDELLLSASSGGKLIIVEKVLAKPDVMVDACDERGRTAMYLAASNNCVDLGRVLIEHGANFFCRDSDGFAPLHIAALKGHAEFISLMLELDPNIVDMPHGFRKENAIIYSVTCRHAKVVKVLVDHRADLAFTTSEGWTPLHIAAVWDCNLTLQALLDGDADPNSRDAVGRTPLCMAIEEGKVPAAEILMPLSDEALLSRRSTWLLGKACLRGDAMLGIIEQLCQRCPNVIQTSAFCDIQSGSVRGDIDPMHAALMSSAEKVVSYLLQIGVDANVHDDDGHTPLIAQIYRVAGVQSQGGPEFSKCMDVFQLLIDRKVDVSAQTSQGVTPVVLTAACGQSDILRTLLEHGGDVEEKYQGRPLLYWAINRGHDDCVKVLLQHGAYSVGLVAVSDQSDSESPMCWAALSGNSASVRLLYNAGASVNGDGPRCPLRLACTAMLTDTAELLFELGARMNDEIDAACENGWPLLYNAVKEQNYGIAKIALECKADPNIACGDDEEPLLNKAAQQEHLDLVQLLLHKGASSAHVDQEFYDGLVQKKQWRIAWHIFTAKVESELKADEYATPLHTAALRGDAEFVDKCIIAGDDPEEQACGKTSLDLCRECLALFPNDSKEFERYEALVIQLQNFIQRRRLDAAGASELTLAVASDDFNRVKDLLDSGADGEAKDPAVTDTPAGFASSLQRDAIATYITQFVQAKKAEAELLQIEEAPNDKAQPSSKKGKKKPGKNNNRKPSDDSPMIKVQPAVTTEKTKPTKAAPVAAPRIVALPEESPASSYASAASALLEDHGSDSDSDEDSEMAFVQRFSKKQGGAGSFSPPTRKEVKDVKEVKEATGGAVLLPKKVATKAQFAQGKSAASGLNLPVKSKSSAVPLPGKNLVSPTPVHQYKATVNALPAPSKNGATALPLQSKGPAPLPLKQVVPSAQLESPAPLPLKQVVPSAKSAPSKNTVPTVNGQTRSAPSAAPAKGKGKGKANSLPAPASTTPSATSADKLASQGLANERGQNNCFLNVVTQSLFRLTAFRKHFMSEAASAPSGLDIPLVRSLASVFVEFGAASNGGDICISGDGSAASANSVRMALSSLYCAQSRFQSGEMDDAAEAFEAILSNLHEQLASAGNPLYPCIMTHFATDILEHGACPCCSAALPRMSYKEYVCYVSADELVAGRMAADSTSGTYSLAQAIRAAKATSMSCPNKSICANRDTITLLRCAKQLPKTFVLGLAWASASATRESVTALLECIALDLDLARIFDVIGDSNQVGRAALVRLCGVLCYYGSHYVVFWQSLELGGWTSFDDVTVRRVKSWDEVRDKCTRGRLQPLLLFYSEG